MKFILVIKRSVVYRDGQTDGQRGPAPVTLWNHCLPANNIVRDTSIPYLVRLI